MLNHIPLFKTDLFLNQKFVHGKLKMPFDIFVLFTELTNPL